MQQCHQLGGFGPSVIKIGNIHTGQAIHVWFIGRSEQSCVFFVIINVINIRGHSSQTPHQGHDMQQFRLRQHPIWLCSGHQRWKERLVHATSIFPVWDGIAGKDFRMSPIAFIQMSNVPFPYWLGCLPCPILSSFRGTILRFCGTVCNGCQDSQSGNAVCILLRYVIQSI